MTSASKVSVKTPCGARRECATPDRRAGDPVRSAGSPAARPHRGSGARRGAGPRGWARTLRARRPATPPPVGRRDLEHRCDILASPPAINAATTRSRRAPAPTAEQCLAAPTSSLTQGSTTQSTYPLRTNSQPDDSARRLPNTSGAGVLRCQTAIVLVSVVPSRLCAWPHLKTSTSSSSSSSS
jgi:hypothetical protein